MLNVRSAFITAPLFGSLRIMSRIERMFSTPQLQPDVAPQVLHFMQVPLRTSV